MRAQISPPLGPDDLMLPLGILRRIVTVLRLGDWRKRTRDALNANNLMKSINPLIVLYRD